MTYAYAEAVRGAYDALNEMVESHPNAAVQLFNWKVLGQHPADVDAHPAIDHNGVHIADVNGLYPGREWDPYGERGIDEDRFRELWEKAQEDYDAAIKARIERTVEEQDIDIKDGLDELMQATGRERDEFSGLDDLELYTELWTRQIYYQAADHLFSDRIYSPPNYLRTTINDMDLSRDQVAGFLDDLHTYQDEEQVDIQLWAYDEEMVTQPLPDDVDELLSFDRPDDVEAQVLRDMSREIDGRHPGESVEANLLFTYEKDSAVGAAADAAHTVLSKAGIDSDLLDSVADRSFQLWLKLDTDDTRDGVYPFITFNGADMYSGEDRAVELIDMLESSMA